MSQSKRVFRGGSSRGNKRPAGRGRTTKQTINPAKFINRDVARVSDDAVAYQPEHTFADFRLGAKIQANLDAAGFVHPSAIQDKTIPLAMEGRDVIGLANTGTGKTAAFLLPIIDRLQHQRDTESVLIMAPTRELAQQIQDEFKRFTRDMKLYSVLLVGGVNINPQVQGLRRRPQVIIGTPGRLKDHLTRGTLKLGHVTTFVLDEADRMLDMGFVHDIRQVASLLPSERQTLCFSATLGPEVKKIIHDFMRDPELVSVKVTETNDHIYQDVVHFADNQHKRDLLVRLLANEALEKVIIFGETKYGVQRLSDNLKKLGITAQAIHGNKTQGQRNRALEDFKTNKSRVLVATDVAARGLDIPNVSHVINYDTPQTYDDYVHRIGRTGRGGKTGTALTFVPKSNVSNPSGGQPRRPQAPQNSPASQQRRRPRTSRQNEASLVAAIAELGE